MVALQLRQLDVPPGQRLLIRDLDWTEFEAVLLELGDRRSSRIAYSDRTLEIRMPTPEHEVDKEIISDIVKFLLDESERNFECFGSTTFKQKSMSSGIEPDQCFYIENSAKMRGKRRLNLAVDPPPDLAIEVDVTSKTQMDAYVGLGVRELWVYGEGELKIYLLEGESYQQATTSPTFPNLDIIAIVKNVIQDSIAEGRSPALRAFRRQLRSPS